MTEAAPIASYAALGAAVALAWAVASKRPEHRPVALALSLLFVSDLARRALRVLVLDPVRSAAPFQGGARVAAAATMALTLAWPAALAAVALVVFVRRPAWPSVIAWALASGALIASYPAIRGAALARCYLAAEMLSCVVALACAVVWYRRSTERTSPAQAVLLILIAGELASLAVWPFGPFDRWDLVRAMNFVTFGVVILLQGGSLWESRSR
jgi:hypothetical protein